MKKYKVSVLKAGEAVDFSSLPVAKITHYPLEKRAYKPYALGAICYSHKEIALNFSAFEVNPHKHSQIGGVFYIYKEPEKALEVWLTPDEATAFIRGEGEKTDVSMTVFRKQGEDLQGKFWGGEFFLSKDELSRHGTLRDCEEGFLLGNFFKISNEEPAHFGSFDGVKFLGIPLWKEKMTKLDLVRY